MPFYIGDWKKDPGIQVLTREQRMIWFEMLMLMWESAERGYLTINGNPIPDEMLAVALNLDNQILSKTLTTFETLGLFSRRENDGAIYSRKQVEIVELSEKRKNAGIQGGNPNLVNQKSTKSVEEGLPNAVNENENTNEDLTLIVLNENADRFSEFWDLYDKKVRKPAAQKQWDKLTEAEKQKVMDITPAYVRSKPEKQYRLDPERFLKYKSFNDEIIEAKNGTNKNNGGASPEFLKGLVQRRADKERLSS